MYTHESKQETGRDRMGQTETAKDTIMHQWQWLGLVLYALVVDDSHIEEDGRERQRQRDRDRQRECGRRKGKNYIRKRRRKKSRRGRGSRKQEAEEKKEKENVTEME